MGRRPRNPVFANTPTSDADRATAAFRAKARREETDPPAIPAAVARKGHNGPDDKTILKHMRATDMAYDDEKTRHAKYMAACKAAEEDGVDVKMLTSTRKSKRKNLAELISEKQRELHYLMLRNCPITQMQLFPEEGSVEMHEVLTETIEEAREWDAEDQGYNACKAGRSKTDHGFPVGSAQAAAWRKGWNRFNLGESGAAQNQMAEAPQE